MPSPREPAPSSSPSSSRVPAPAPSAPERAAAAPSGQNAASRQPVVTASATAPQAGSRLPSGPMPPGDEGRGRAVIDAVLPAVNGAGTASKRGAGEPGRVTGHCFTDVHDVLRAMLPWCK